MNQHQTLPLFSKERVGTRRENVRRRKRDRERKGDSEKEHTERERERGGERKEGRAQERMGER